MKKLVWALLAAAVLVLALAALTSAADYPNGCTDCHRKVAPDKDYTLAAEIARIPNHPKGFSELSKCMMCHKAGSKYEFRTVLHKVHFEGEHFKTYKEQGNYCLTCHGIANDGAVFLKGL
ncbi:MAG: hypothetical protein QJR13_08640 [Bacillota bacterium]|nr:hypothetical protein [Bacillota bacterium]